MVLIRHNKKFDGLFLALLLLSVLLTASSFAASPNKVPDETLINLNDSWLYLHNNTNDWRLASSATEWQSVTLPHTWNAFDTLDAEPGYRRSASWYKRTLNINSQDRITQLYFEGANFETKVFVNGQLAGEHTGGYIGFHVDLTGYLHNGADNEILVRVSNAYNPNLIPSQKADFFLFGGITRDVWLKQLPLSHINHVTVKTPQVSESASETEVVVEIVNGEQQGLRLRASLIDPQNNVVEVLSPSAITENQADNITRVFSRLEQPALWSVDSPNLYLVKVELMNELDQVIHTKLVRFGYRWFEMKPHKGFYLNGKPLLIRGTHRHEEHAGVGAAMSNAQHRKDMQMIKDMGANFVRLGHYPQDPEVYRAADELGLLIWDELPWCRGGKGGPEWERNTEHLWRAQVRQNINHPSIVFWSLGNEVYWEEDFPGGGATEVINPYLEKLNALTKSLDDSRLTSIRKYYPGSHLVDAFSPSIWAGWYGGSYNQYEAALKNAHKQYPTFLHMEYGGSSHVGRHTETPVTAAGLAGAQVSVAEAVNQAVVRSVAKDTDWNENYMVDLFDWHLNVSENFPHFAGNAQWAFKDFGTPLRPENPLPYMNQKGLVDREGNPKDAYHVFASYWSPTPVCYIESKTWTHRNGPEQGRDVTVYCNTEQAELFLNGRSLGRKDKQDGVVPAGGYVWATPFENGWNQLEVIGFDAGKQVVKDSTKVNYLVGKHGKFKQILLNAKPLDDKRWLITAEAVDKNGHRVLNYSERAHFFNIGDQGKLIEHHGTPTKSSIIEMASGFASIIYEAADQPSIIEFRSQNIKGVYVSVGGVYQD